MRFGVTKVRPEKRGGKSADKSVAQRSAVRFGVTKVRPEKRGGKSATATLRGRAERTPAQTGR